jgi:hypothetical protein
MADVLEDGMEYVVPRCRRERMLLQQYSSVAPNWKCCSRRRHETWGKPEMGEERGWEVAQVWRFGGLEVTTNCDADVHVRSGGEGLRD